MFKKSIYLLLLFFSFHVKAIAKKKPWTFLVYIAADNDLEVFLERNIKQMTRIGSNEFINIIIQVNMVEKQYHQKISKTIYIEKGNPKILHKTTQPYATDSGDAQTLINFCCTAIEEFPAEHYALIFWNHGTGTIDPYCKSRSLTADSFSFYSNTMPMNNDFFPFSNLSITTAFYKAVCFDDTTGNSLTEQKLMDALNIIKKKALQEKKFDIIGFDACLMAMIEVASSIRPFADFMVASQEVELGTGWDYGRVLSPFREQALTPEEFGTHIVKAYKKTYQFTDDFTFSCLKLKHIKPLEELIKKLALLLQEGCKEKSIKEMIGKSRYKHFCTHFDEPDFIDLQHFLKNLKENSFLISCATKKATENYRNMLLILVAQIEKELHCATKISLSGNFFSNAYGLSIYFPEQKIHRSYRANCFAQTTQWISFLRNYFS